MADWRQDPLKHICLGGQPLQLRTPPRRCMYLPQTLDNRKTRSLGGCRASFAAEWGMSW